MLQQFIDDAADSLACERVFAVNIKWQLWKQCARDTVNDNDAGSGVECAHTRECIRCVERRNNRHVTDAPDVLQRAPMVQC